MKLKRCSNCSMVIVLALLGATTPLHSQTQSAPDSHLTARGIYLAGEKLAVAAEVIIERGGQRGVVPPNFEFRSGDHFWLSIVTDQDAYIYVLNRTMKGRPDEATKGIRLIADSDRQGGATSPDAYNLVFPAPRTAARLIKAHKQTVIPASGQYFVMDQEPGAEKLMVIASPTPQPPAISFINGSSGKATPPGSRTVDSNGGVLGRLNTELVEMADNTETEEPPKTKSISIVPNPFPSPGNGSASGKAPEHSTNPTGVPPSGAGTPVVAKSKTNTAAFGATRKPGKPILLDLTLVHLPN